MRVQANLQEGRHALARKIFHGRAGQLYQRYQDGMEAQLGARPGDECPGPVQHEVHGRRCHPAARRRPRDPR
ncbi:transposase [Streptomyces sp. NBC_01527]